MSKPNFLSKQKMIYRLLLPLLLLSTNTTNTNTQMTTVIVLSVAAEISING